jgi:predicted transglutaminase-like cysteine proteinase
MLKQFAVGVGFVMFVSSLPATKERMASKPEPQRAFQQASIAPAAIEMPSRAPRKPIATRIVEQASYAPPPPPISPKPVFLTTFGQSLPPVGFVSFCKKNGEDCRTNGNRGERVQLTDARLDQLRAVNRYVNESVEPVTDTDLYGEVEVWTYPGKGKGDCEDYVLLKRRLLIERGWPEGALAITVVRDENQEGHAVLTVRTDAGDFVLDNKNPKVLAWKETPYIFVKQQSKENPLLWVSLLPPDQAPQTNVSASNRRNAEGTGS